MPATAPRSTTAPPPAAGPGAASALSAGALLPLRFFLGATYVYAAAQKLYDPAFLDPSAAGSFAAQTAAVRGRTPIGFALGMAQTHPTVFGLLIAFGELAVGIGTLLGLWTRIAAGGGLALALTFFLTVSWNTDPYYYGPDLVFAVGWLTLALAGPLRWSLDAWLAARAAAAGPGDGELVPRRAATRADAVSGRRSVLQRGAVTGITAGVALIGGAGIGALGRGRKRAEAEPASGPAGRAGGPAQGPTPAARSATTTAIAPTTPGARAELSIPVQDVPATGAAALTAADGTPVFVARTPEGSFRACRGICTHAGCPIALDPARALLACPCHGSTFDPQTGVVVDGPAKDPLPALPLSVTDGVVRVQGA